MATFFIGYGFQSLWCRSADFTYLICFGSAHTNLIGNRCFIKIKGRSKPLYWRFPPVCLFQPVCLFFYRKIPTCTFIPTCTTIPHFRVVFHSFKLQNVFFILSFPVLLPSPSTLPPPKTNFNFPDTPNINKTQSNSSHSSMVQDGQASNSNQIIDDSIYSNESDKTLTSTGLPANR